MKVTKGRPKKYTDQELKEVLLKFSVKNKGKINCLQLEKATGVKRHVWARRLGEEIKRLNQPLKNINISSGDVPMPNMEELVEKYGDNRSGLIKALGHLNEVIFSLYEQAKASKEKTEEISQMALKLQEKESVISQLSSEVNHYKRLYEQAYVKSTYTTLKQDENLKDNLISINKNRERSLGANLETAFPELFED